MRQNGGEPVRPRVPSVAPAAAAWVAGRPTPAERQRGRGDRASSAPPGHRDRPRDPGRREGRGPLRSRRPRRSSRAGDRLRHDAHLLAFALPRPDPSPGSRASSSPGASRPEARPPSGMGPRWPIGGPELPDSRREPGPACTSRPAAAAQRGSPPAHRPGPFLLLRRRGASHSRPGLVGAPGRDRAGPSPESPPAGFLGASPSTTPHPPRPCGSPAPWRSPAARSGVARPGRRGVGSTTVCDNDAPLRRDCLKLGGAAWRYWTAASLRGGQPIQSSAAVWARARDAREPTGVARGLRLTLGGRARRSAAWRRSGAPGGSR